MAIMVPRLHPILECYEWGMFVCAAANPRVEVLIEFACLMCAKSPCVNIYGQDIYMYSGDKYIGTYAVTGVVAAKAASTSACNCKNLHRTRIYARVENEFEVAAAGTAGWCCCTC